MTEITDTPLSLSESEHAFVLHWGEFGSVWGVNRSVAQIHALLFMAARPLNAETIADALGLARSNVSTSLRDLVDWGLVRRAPVPGDRRDHFEAEGDVWEMVKRIVALRKTRELDPAAGVLAACRRAVEADPAASGESRRRLAALDDLVTLLDGFYEQTNRLPKATVMPLLRLGGAAIEALASVAPKAPHER